MKNKLKFIFGIMFIITFFIAFSNKEIKATESNIGNTSLYMWGIRDIDYSKFSKVIKYLNINTLYIGRTDTDEHRDLNSYEYTSLFSFMQKNDLKAYIVYDEKYGNQSQNLQKIKDLINQVNEYNQKSDYKISGIAIDSEFHTTDEYGEADNQKRIQMFREYVSFMTEAHQYANSKDLVYVACIPPDYDTYLSEALVEELIQNGCDIIQLMNYDKEQMITAISTEIELAKKYNKQIESIAELQKPGYNGVDEYITFWYDGLDVCTEKFKEIANTYNYQLLTFSYHYYNPVMQLAEEVINFENESSIKGDIDGDGNVTINDLAILKLYLINKITLTDIQLESANIDNDNTISINDLARLKLILINMNTEEPDITRYQFTYHITGELKKAFEDKLDGEKIDYSVDRFYLVKNTNNKTYIYNPYRKIKLEVPENYKLLKRKATWYWRPNTFQENQSEFLDNLINDYGITDIYLHLSPKFFKLEHSENEFNIEKLKKFVEDSYNRDIRVYCLVGDPSYISLDKWDITINGLIDDIDSYNKSVDVSQRLAGISYDNEFWLNPEWKTDENVRKQHIEYIKTAVEYANKKNLDINFALQFTIPRYDYTDENGNKVNMYDAVSQILEEPVLMIYRDSANKIYSYINDIQTNATESIFEISKRNGCSINIAVDTAYHEPTESNPNPGNQTFYEEELENRGGQGAINRALNTITELCRNNNNSDEFSFSIHHAETLGNFSSNKI